MASKIDLITRFYSGLPMDRAKIESSQFGFAYLNDLLSGGAQLEYGESHPPGRPYKYKLSHIPPARMSALLQAHVEKLCNVCLYFDAEGNDLLCFNLDNNQKADSDAEIPEMNAAVRNLRSTLSALDLHPLQVSSGRGFHFWLRLSQKTDNTTLYQLMLGCMVQTMSALHHEGLDHRKIKANFYPNPSISDVVSLRLFGSAHSRTGKFSHVMADDGPLDEDRSWDAFAKALAAPTVTSSHLDAALARLPDTGRRD